MALDALRCNHLAPLGLKGLIGSTISDSTYESRYLNDNRASEQKECCKAFNGVCFSVQRLLTNSVRL